MIIFGLGNPGRRYRFTRHNAGHLFLEQLARYYRKKFLRRKYYSVSAVKIMGSSVVLIKPRCWMNQCGEVMGKIIQEYDTKYLVVLDDINLPAGRIRLRSRGSDGGHLGLRSVISALQTEDFPRLRIGIGRAGGDATGYVLERFTAAENKVLRKVMKDAIRGIQVMFSEDFIKAQNYINSINIKDIG
jgi:PTH1 family peptidyl-tRNA hydrolase